MTCSCRRAAASTICSIIPASRPAAGALTDAGARFIAIRDLAAGDELTYDYSCHLLSSRRAAGLRLRDALVPRRDRPVRQLLPKALQRHYLQLGVVSPAAATALRLTSVRRARRPRRRRGSCTCADRRPAGRDPGRVDLGGEGRPVRGRQRQLPGQPPGRATGLGLSRSRRHRRHRRAGPGTRPRAGPAGGGDGGLLLATAVLVAVAAAALGPGAARSAAGAADSGAPLQHRVGDHALAGRGGLVARPRAAPRHGLDLSRHGPGRLRRRGRPSSACSTSAPRTALLAGTLAPMLYAALWLAASDRALGHGGADSSTPTDEPATVATGPAGTWSALFAHPLGPPLGAASFMLTFVWVLTEFLCFARYQQDGRPASAPRVPGTDLRLAAAGGVRLHRAVRRARHPLGPAGLAQRDLPRAGRS